MAPMLTKTYTTSTVTCYVLDETNTPAEVSFEVDRRISLRDAMRIARQRYEQALVADISSTKTRYSVAKDAALYSASDTPTDDSDIKIRYTETAVYCAIITDDDDSKTQNVRQAVTTYNKPLSKSRAFAQTRRDFGDDVIPYKYEHTRKVKYIPVNVFKQIAESTIITE